MNERGSHPPAENILVRGVNWLGDAVMSTPALLCLRGAFPQARITLLTHARLAQLWTQHPGIDRLLTFEPGESLWSIARRLRSENFSLALVLPNSPRSALEVFLARIPRRVGGAWPWRNWFLTEAVPPAPAAVKMRKRTAAEVRGRIRAGAARETFPATAHQVRHCLRLAAALGADPTPLAPKLFLTADEQRAASSLFTAQAEAAAGRTLTWGGLNPGAEYGPAKRWPAASFIAAANEVSRRAGIHWMILGGARDRPLADEIAHHVPTALNLCGATTLRELMMALGHCRVLLSNDTGPMHVAAALGTPVVVPFGSTSPELTGPGLPGDSRHQLLTSPAPCAPCFRRECPIDLRCLTGISVEAVVAAVLRGMRP